MADAKVALEPMLPFVTGSTVYGERYRKLLGSDLDLVVLVSHETLAILIREYEHDPESDDYEGVGNGSIRIHRGGLDLIVTAEPEIFGAWKIATDFLIAFPPESREKAVQVVEAHLEAARVRMAMGKGKTS